MKTQEERMIAGEHYNAHCQELEELRLKTKKMLHKLNVTEYHSKKFKKISRTLFPNSAKDFYVEPPFYCDYGNYIYAEEKVFINFGAVILDGGTVKIGANTLMGPGVHIYTAQHPTNAIERLDWEDCKPVTIGKNCWIGGHSTICPGVTIGDRCVIGAGSVVIKDIPADSLAVGNPARIVRKLNCASSFENVKK